MGRLWLRKYSWRCTSLKVDSKETQHFFGKVVFVGYLFTSGATPRYWIPNCARWLLPRCSPLTNQPFTTTIPLLSVWSFSYIKIRLGLGATWEKLNFRFSWEPCKSFCFSANCSCKCFTRKAASCPLKRLATLHFKHTEDVLSSLLISPRLLTSAGVVEAQLWW